MSFPAIPDPPLQSPPSIYSLVAATVPQHCLCNELSSPSTLRIHAVWRLYEHSLMTESGQSQIGLKLKRKMKISALASMFFAWPTSTLDTAAIGFSSVMTVVAPVSMKSQTNFNFLKPTRPPQLTHRLFGKVPSPTTHLLRAEKAFKDLLAQLKVILIHQSSAYSLLLDRDCSRVVSGTSNRPFGFLGILCYDSNASLVHRSPIFCLQRMRRRSEGGKKKRRKPVERNLTFNFIDWDS